MNCPYQEIEIGQWYKVELNQEKDGGEVERGREGKKTIKIFCLLVLD